MNHEENLGKQSRSKMENRSETDGTMISNDVHGRVTRSRTQNLNLESRQVSDCKINDAYHVASKSRLGSVTSKSDYLCNASCNSSVIDSIKSSRHSRLSKSQLSSVTCRLDAINLSNAIKEEIAHKTMEGELINLEAEALERRAAVMRKHSNQLLEISKDKELMVMSVMQQLNEDSDEEMERNCNKVADTASAIKDREHLMSNYLEDCHRARKLEQGQVMKMRPLPNEMDRAEAPRPMRMIKTDLPRVELPKFDGKSAEYWNFIRQFEIHIENRTDDAQQRLLYLMNHCTGKAKLAIDGYAILPPDEGYTKARAALQRAFGQPHVISRNMIDDIIKLPDVRRYDADALRHLAMKMEGCHATLNQMNYMADIDSVDVLHKIVDKLPDETADRWIRKTHELYDQGIEPRFKDLYRLIDMEAAVAESRYAERRKRGDSHKCNPSTNTPRYEAKWRTYDSPREERGGGSRAKEVNYVNKDRVKSCIVCNEAHATSQCSQYIAMQIDQRWEKIKTLGGCFSCLKIGHAVKACLSKGICGINGCVRQHHPSLHRERATGEPLVKTILTSSRDKDSYVSLGFMPVNIIGPKGITKVCALLDTGSNTTLVRKEVVTRLGIKGNRTEININTVTGNSVMSAIKCDFDVQAVDNADSVHMSGVYALDQLPVRLHTKTHKNELQRWPHLEGIPRRELDGQAVEMIIGCDQTKAHWIQDVRLGKEGQPFALKTPLGWIVLGPMHQEGVQSVYCTHVQQIKEDCGIEDMLRQLYNKDFEDLGSNERELSAEEKEAVKTLTLGTHKDQGHYVVPLPWKAKTPELPNNRAYAIRRLEGLRKGFSAQPKLVEQYNEILMGHLRKGYIAEVGEKETSDDRAWYVPHHPVVNPHKPGKLRIVFDCAAKYGNKSINEFLHQGPDTINSLVGVLLRFRREPIVIMADIEEMFLQVRLVEEDQDWMRFLWWQDGDMQKPINAFKMLVHPFGARSSPFCANFALKRAIMDNQGDLSERAMEIAVNNIYVDDCIASVENVEIARKVIAELTLATSKGGFKLRKWLSNRKEVLTEVPAEDLASKVQLLADKELPTERTLGVEWNAELDVLRFTFLDNDKPNSRRGVLSTMAAHFDPLGLISPAVMKAKILLQNLCKRKLDWDQELDGRDLTEWLEWKNQMKSVNKLSFQRCIKDEEPSSEHQLHIFADASEIGYGAVAYVRRRVRDGHQCRLLMAKARVAPLKTVTIPRLELNAAVLAVRMGKTITRELREEFEGVYYWVDSTIVLHYLRNTSSRFVTFVANRIQEILEATSVGQWRHVRSEYNPADYVSRGLAVLDDRFVTWIRGPSFLNGTDSNWQDSIPSMSSNDQLETRRVVLHVDRVAETSLDKLLEHYSEWTKLVRAVAWLNRFTQYYRTMKGKGDTLRIGCLTVSELQNSEGWIIKYVQKRVFSEEYTALTTNSHGFDWRINRLRKLSPELRQGLIVVGGRLQLANRSEESKHPIILPKEHAVTEAIIRHVHRMDGHTGTSQTLAALRTKYWVLNGGATVKSVLRKCLTCRRLNATSMKQRMAILPEVRIEDGWYPFRFVGLDYFGPFRVKRGRLLEKRYGCIFTCLQCRAIHLELAHTMSTDSFILALMRFINRRGTPAELLSDNGGNFIGAERELGDWLKGLSQTKITDKMADKRIVWKFNPPGASHRGGIWERLIRSVRKILNSVSGRQSMDEETLWTYLTQAERVVNDRPLMAVREGAGEPTPIRPSDLLQPKSNSFVAINLPMGQLVEKRWRIVNSLTAEFWKRWKIDYLNSLQVRQKWFRKERELQVGDLVITEVESVPRTWWPLAIVKEIIPDADGLVRTVVVKTSSGEYKRDIRKVYLLEGTV